MSKKTKSNKILLLFFSLILAMGLWIYIMGEQSVEVTKKVPLEVFVPEGATVVSDTDIALTVILSVPRNLMRLLDSSPLSVTHHIYDFDTTGKYSFYLKAQDVKRPSALIKVQRIIPERVTITLDEVINKRLPIVANLVNEPAAGYKVDQDSIQIDPNAVLVSGAKSVLEKVTFVLTESIDIIGRIRSFRKKVALKTDINYTIANPGLVDVFIPINEEFSQKEFVGIPIRILHAPQKPFKITIQPEKTTCTLRGPRKSIEAITNEQLLVYVDVIKLEAGKYKLPLHFTLPDGVTLNGTAPVVDVVIGSLDQELPVNQMVITTNTKK